MRIFDWAMVWVLVLFILKVCGMIEITMWMVWSPMILLLGLSMIYVIVMGVAKGIEDAKKN